MRELARENGEQAARVEILNGDGNLVVIAGSETGRPVFLLCWS
jgi:hypothetical protein